MTGGPIRLFDSPIRYMRERAAGPPQWATAVTPLAIYAAASSAAGVVVGERTSAAIRAGMEQAGQAVPDVPAVFSIVIGGGSTAMVAAAAFALQAGVLAATDILAVQSGRVKRLIELAALSYWTQVIYAVGALAVSTMYFDPEPLRLLPGVASVELQQALVEYSQYVRQGDLSSSLVLIRQMFTVWLVALYAMALRVVSGLTVGGAWAAGVVLAVLFILVPALVQRGIS